MPSRLLSTPDPTTIDDACSALSAAAVIIAPAAGPQAFRGDASVIALLEAGLALLDLADEPAVDLHAGRTTVHARRVGPHAVAWAPLLAANDLALPEAEGVTAHDGAI